MTNMPDAIKKKRDEILPRMCSWAVMSTIGDNPMLPYMRHAFDAGYGVAQEEIEEYERVKNKLLDDIEYQKREIRKLRASLKEAVGIVKRAAEHDSWADAAHTIKLAEDVLAKIQADWPGFTE